MQIYYTMPEELQKHRLVLGQFFLAGATIDDRAESLRLTQEALEFFRERYANDPLLYLVVFNQYSRSGTMLKCSTPLNPLYLLS